MYIMIDDGCSLFRRYPIMLCLKASLSCRTAFSVFERDINVCSTSNRLSSSTSSFLFHTNCRAGSPQEQNFGSCCASSGGRHINGERQNRA